MQQRPAKKDVANTLLSRGSLFLHLDPRAEGVVVPAWLAKQPQLVLQVGLDLPVPIPDLHIDDDGVCATLSFNRSGFACSVPWPSVFALVGDDGMGVVWPEDMPPEIAAEVERATRAPAPRAALRAIDGGKDEAPAEASVTDTKSEPEQRPRPHLRRVK